MLLGGFETYTLDKMLLGNVKIENRKMFDGDWVEQGRFLDPSQLPRNSKHVEISTF